MSQFKPETGLTQDDLNEALSSFRSESQGFGGEDYSGAGGREESGYDFESNLAEDLGNFKQSFSEDLNRWKDEYTSEQAGRATDYQSMMTDAASEEGEFNPDLFRNLLGELESSKRRQKDWNERTAKEAYKY